MFSLTNAILADAGSKKPKLTLPPTQLMLADGVKKNGAPKLKAVAEGAAVITDRSEKGIKSWLKNPDVAPLTVRVVETVDGTDAVAVRRAFQLNKEFLTGAVGAAFKEGASEAPPVPEALQERSRVTVGNGQS